MNRIVIFVFTEIFWCFRAMEIFKLNIVGPQKYLATYRKYAHLLNNKAEQDVTAFLEETHSIEEFKLVSINYRLMGRQFIVFLMWIMKGYQFRPPEGGPWGLSAPCYLISCFNLHSGKKS